MATKYVSSLTGDEMDAALIDMAYHNSEAYAVGTRNGVAVGSSDVTYHNNSKYWAEQVYGYTDRAEDAANRAEAAVPSGTAGAVFFDRAQTLTSAQQAQARANIRAGGTNYNLLDNWWFGNPVNQRGLTSYSGSGLLKTIDRWILFNGSGTNSLSVQSGYISVKSDSNGFGQFVENSVGAALNGKTVTCSVMFNDGSITSATGIYSNSSLVSLGNGFYIGLNGGKQTIVSYLTGTTAQNIKAMKVELGTISTLANDAPPDYGEELRKCQYYFRRITVQDNGFIALGWATSATAAQFPNILGTDSMRIKPTATPTGAVYVRDPSGTDHAVSSFTVQYDPTIVCLQANTSGLTANTVARLRIGAGGRIDLSADL